jgi:hypothetical protein
MITIERARTMVAGLEVWMPANHNLRVSVSRRSIRDAAANVVESSEIELSEMSRCPHCNDFWPAEDLYTNSGLCPNGVITNHYEARQRRLATGWPTTTNRHGD